MDYKEETIAAIATPIGIGGIGIIRISGDDAESIAGKIFRSKSPIKSFDSFRLYLGHIIDPKSNLPVDEVLLSTMHAPFSYTREDVVEVNSHSGYTIFITHTPDNSSKWCQIGSTRGIYPEGLPEWKD